MPTSDDAIRRVRVTGDSMTEYGTWPQLVAAATGWALAANTARSGQTSTEIAVRDGALQMTLVVTALCDGAVVAVRPLYPTTSFRQFIDEPMDDILIAGELAGTSGELRHAVRAGALEQWSFTTTPGAAAGGWTVGDVLVFTPRPHPVEPDTLAVLWCGRNNVNSDALRDLDVMVHRLQHSDPQARFLVLGIANSELEPVGTAGHAAVVALNADLARRYGPRFVDVRAALLSPPLSTELDAADQRLDVPPRSLRRDTIHLAEAGDRLVADAVLRRVAELGWSATDHGKDDDA